MGDRVETAGQRTGLIEVLDLRLVSGSARRGRLTAPGLSVPCAIGRSGVGRLKREGDGITPAGTLRIIKGFYRNDHFPVRPRSAIPLRPLRPSDGWGDQPLDANYNRPLRRPYGASHEAMWREDGLYDLVLVLDWNIAPRRQGRGSAIFFHLARPDFSPTAGCVAVERAAMLAILARLAPDAAIRVR